MFIVDTFRSETWSIFLVSAAFAGGAFTVALKNYRATVRKDRIAGLAPELERLRAGQIFEIAESVSMAAEQNAWAVLDTERDAACHVMAALSGAARVISHPDAWHALLRGHEYDTINRFLRDTIPLVLALRHTSLGVAGKTRPYNGNKSKTLAEVYRALGHPDPSPAWGAWRVVRRRRAAP